MKILKNMITTYPGLLPLPPVKRGPLRLVKAGEFIDRQALAQIPRFCYTAIILQRIMPYPQLEPPREKPMESL